jgi:hypothetical protein
MRKVLLSLTLPGLVLGLFLQASAAQAQSARTWVSGVGDDLNSCSRTAPCRTFAGAILKTTAGGQINVVDPGSYGTVTITKAITIDAAGSFAGVLAPAGSDAIVVNAGASDNVVLRGLTIDGNGSGANGVRFLAGASLTIQDCTIANFRAASPDGFGVLVVNTAGTAEIHIVNSTIENNGAVAAATGGGVQVKPAAVGTGARVTLDRVQILNNVLGFKADGIGNSGSLSTIRSSTIASNNTAGVHAVSGTASHINVISTSVVNNGGVGVIADGASAFVRLNDASISANNLGITALNGGVLESFGNNQIRGNIAGNGTPNTFVPLQ